jgi:hypothetical protein
MRCQKWGTCRSVGSHSLRKICNPFSLFKRNWSCSTLFDRIPWHPNTRRQVVDPRLRTRVLKELWWVREPQLAQKILSWWLNSTLYFRPRGIASSPFSDMCRFFLGTWGRFMDKSLYSVEWHREIGDAWEYGRNGVGEFHGSVVVSCFRNGKTTTAFYV